MSLRPGALLTDPPPMLWTADQYAAAYPGGITPRGARKHLARWYANGHVRVVREMLPARGPGEPPRTRYLLDVDSWRRACGVDDAA